MKFNFDEPINRYGTDSAKYDFAQERGRPEGVLPMWVADMDFRAPPSVGEAIERVVRHGIYGYTGTKEDYFEAVADWFRSGFGYSPEQSWMIKTPGVVFALAIAVRAFTQPGEAVIIQRPVYYPFSHVIESNGRKIVNSALLRGADGVYTIDFDDFERQIVENSVRLFILCSPHNPIGRVWTRAELERLGEICLKHGVIVVSDEIHCDFVYPGHRHTVFGTLAPELADNAIICTAPSKTFNIAGMHASNIFISNKELRERFSEEIKAVGGVQVNMLGLAACRAAYTDGREWLDELLVYLRDNFNLMSSFLSEKLPEISFTAPQGTYLAWLDFAEYGKKRGCETPGALDEFITNRAGLWLDGGDMFGPEGAGFQRINIACTRATLREALEKLAAV